MSEKLITLKETDLNKILGSNNIKFDKIKNFFPHLKLISRGDKIKVVGSKEEISQFELKFNLFIDHLNKYNSLTLNQIERIIEGKENILNGDAKIIVHGKNGNLIKAKTFNQRNMVDAIEKNDVVFAIGPAGTGKTYTSVALAVKYLKEKKVKRIILIRPAIEVGENLGFLPGDLKEKLDPYMQPIYDALFDMIPFGKLNEYIDDGTIQISPLAFMRGRTLDNAFVILDEGQNTTNHQMKMFLTRMGQSAKFMITGDLTQIDLQDNKKSGLLNAKKILKDIKNISFINLDEKDIIRHKLVKQIINAYK
jgi:phosphate starvation-inducible PhoH-like protein